MQKTIEQPDDPIRLIYENVRLNEGIAKLRAFLIQVYLREGVSVKELSWLLRLPVPVVSAIKNECKRQGFVAAVNGIRLTETGTRYVREQLRYEAVDSKKLLQVLDAPDLPLELFAPVIQALEEIYRERPAVDVTVDQSLCTAETGIKRALMMLRAGGLIGQDILLAGDDDLTSVAIVLTLKSLAKTADPAMTALTVVDIDERITRYIDQAARHLGMPVACVRHDLRQPLPEALTARFDAVFTDPPYTLAGLTLFASRAAQALKQESDLYFYLSCAQKDPQTRLAIQRMLSDAGLVITRIYERFNQYHGAQILGGVSDLTVLTTTRETRPIFADAFNEPLYTNETNRSIRVYQCKECRTEYRIGYSEVIKTIERLKELGCPGCGGQTFILRERKTERDEHA